MNRYKVIIGVASIAVIGLVVFLAGKNKESKTFEKLNRIADEGYETAGDILFPLKNPRTRIYQADDNGFTRRGNYHL
ncbi:MAG TPA: hypothetical protein VF610_11325 [Segetibacter sp.]|jgi:hypothetical protein